jgi:hypothetical protein
MAGTSAQGLTFSWTGTTLYVTSVQVSDTNDLVDGTHLGIAPSGKKEWVGGFASNREVTIDYISATVLAAGTSGAISISGPMAFSGNATCMSASVGGSVGDLIKGNATFRVA